MSGASDLIGVAVELLRAGKLVAFPTETVYGLGADATNPGAVHRIFQAKGRPSTNPLIVHVADTETARRYASQWPRVADVLARAFWPGPLTLVVRRSAEIASQATGGGDTVGLRVPNHPVALELLRAFGGAVAAPSANRSNRISPTTADHVRSELGDAVSLILDGGPCDVGIESTVLDLTTDRPRLLRPGQISVQQLTAVMGEIDVPGVTAAEPLDSIQKSPGRHAVHYAPRAPAFVFQNERRPQLLQWAIRNVHTSCVFLLLDARDVLATTHGRHRHIVLPDSPDGYARSFYAALHDADRQNPDVIWVEMPPTGPEWLAVHDRIRRATRDAAHAPGDVRQSSRREKRSDIRRSQC